MQYTSNREQRVRAFSITVFPVGSDEREGRIKGTESNWMTRVYEDTRNKESVLMLINYVKVTVNKNAEDGFSLESAR